MRRVLMVSPHFPPDSSAASHRVRLLAPHLAAAGWTPTVVRLEPRAVGAADAIVAVSQGTIDGIVDRMPEAHRLPHEVIPLGFEAADFDAVDGRRLPAADFAEAGDLTHLCYVGTLLPTGLETL